MAAPLLAAVLAAAGAGADCRSAIVVAAEAEGIAPATLLAIGRVESGLLPWAINAGGVPATFASREAAIAATAALLGRGVRSIDVGCLQINLLWHPDAFASLVEAFDPPANAAYGARFLAGLYRRSGSWRRAVGEYHSALPGAQERYVAAVAAALEPAGSSSSAPVLPAAARVVLGPVPEPARPPAGVAAAPAPAAPANLDPEETPHRQLLLAGRGPIEPDGEGAALLAAEHRRLLAEGGGPLFPAEDGEGAP